MPTKTPSDLEKSLPFLNHKLKTPVLLKIICCVLL